MSKIIPQAGSQSDAPERLSISLVTRGDRALTWGHLPNHETTGELPAAEKLARLKRCIEETGSLEQGDPLPSPLTPLHHRTATLPQPKSE